MTDLCVCVRFNMLAFSGEVRMWQPALVQSTEELCMEAVQWLNQLSTHGASSTLQALQVLATTLEILTLLYIIITISGACVRLSLPLATGLKLTGAWGKNATKLDKYAPVQLIKLNLLKG